MTADRQPSIDDLSPDERELLSHLLGGRAEDGLAATVRDGDRAPLSLSQRRLWVAEQLRPGDPAYHLWVAFRASGALDREALAKGLTEIVRRHAVLRSRVEVADGEPFQRIHPAAAVPLPVVDLTAVAPLAREEAVRREIRAQVRQPFDLSSGPLIRTSLLQCGPNEHVLVLVMHHIVTDGWSMGVLFRELATLYEAFRSKQPSPLAPVPLQYADFAAWQQRRGGDGDRAIVDAWRRDLSGAHATQIAGDRGAGGSDSTGAEELASLGPDLSRAIDALARQEGATRFMTLLTVFCVLLSRYSAERDVLIGIASAGRTRAELEPLIGFFVTMLPLRAEVPPGATFRQTLRGVRARAIAAFDRQDLPFDRLIDALGVERTLDRHPLFQVVFTAQDALMQPLRLADLVLAPLELPATATRFDLEAHVLDARDGVRLAFVYGARRFEAGAVQRLLEHYVALVRACVASPDERLDLLPWVSDAERRALLELARGPADEPAADTVATRVAARAAERPDAIAVVCGRERLTYRELDARASRVASWLRAQGVGRGDRVGVLLDRTVDFVVAVWAAMKAGAAYVPLDPTYPDERLVYMASDSGMRVAVTHAALRGRLSASGVHLLCLDAAHAMDDVPSGTLRSPIDPDDLAYVVYTSGSTGRPKGVEVNHGALANLVQWHVRAFDVTADDCATQVASVGFDACVWEIWPYLSTGARLCLADDDVRSEPMRLWQWLRDEAVTIAFLPTPLAEAALRDGPATGLRLRTLLTGGDRLTLRPAPGWPFALVNNYGPTENAVVTTSGVVRAGETGGPPSIGGPIDHVRTYVLDPHTLQPVPVGVIGELLVGGRSLARGYLGRRSQTAAAFVPDAFSGEPGARLYRTGDLVRWRADGTLDFVGRRDGQVKVRGFRIELGEIDAALARAPGVEAAVAVVHGGGEQRRIVGYVVLTAGSDATGESVRAQVRPWLPSYMVPALVTVLRALPLTAHGKIDRAALPVPVFDDASAPAEPRTPNEATLHRIWREVLGVERIGVHDNFFDVGGDSILSIQIASRATQAGLPLSPRLFFEHQTIAELAARLDTPDHPLAGSAPRRQTGTAEEPATGDAPLTPIQHWFFEQAFAAPEHFNQTVLLELRQALGETAIAEALAALLRHHDVLRSRFTAGPAGLVQHVPVEEGAPALAVLDLSNDSPAMQVEVIATEGARAQASLNLAAGPLVRAVLFRMGDAGAPHDRLLIVAHHLVVDGVSWRILLEDLALALGAASRSAAIGLPARTTSFRAWAEALRDSVRPAAAARTLEYWMGQAAGFEPLPLDRTAAAAANTVGAAAQVSREFSRDETSALLRAVPAATGYRINEVLLAGVALALGRWTGRSAVHVDVEGHGREAIAPHLDISRTVGWFTSLYPLRFELPPLEGDALDRLTVSGIAATLRAVPLGGVDYGVLRYLGADRGTRERLGEHQPQVSFNYLGQFDGGERSALFGLAPEPVGASIAARNRRRHLIEINARISGGRLRVEWTYCPALHAPETVARLAEVTVSAIGTFAAAALAPPEPGGHQIDRLLANVGDDTLADLSRRYARERLEDVYPLGPLQHGMVVHALRASGTGAFVSQFELVLDADVDPAHMRQAWTRLQERHPILRTAFVEIGGGDFRQLVLARPELEWTYEDWSELDAGRARQQYEAFRERDRTRGFVPGQVPLRVSLVQLATGRAHVVWTHHHALLDGWSVAMLLDELFRIHEAVSHQRTATLETRPPYRRYIEWLHAQDAAPTETFWRTQLAGVTGPTVLASDRGPGPAGRPPRIEETELFVEADASRALAAFAARQRLTLHAVVLGAWALLLSRHSGEETVVFGTAVSGRPADLDGVEQMVGLFLNGLPMRADVPSGAVVHEWLAGLQARHADVRQHQHAALSDIQRWSSAPAGQPLFEISLAFENYPIAPTLTVAAQRLGVVDFRLAAHTSAVLHLRVVPGDRLRLMLAYDAERFEPEMAGVLLHQLDTILRQLRERPADRVGSIDLCETSGSAVPGPVVPAPAGAIHEDVLAAAARHPERVAIEAALESCTYGALARRSQTVARALMVAGTSASEVVGVYLPRSVDLVVSLIGILRAGCAFAVLDPAYPAARTLDRLRAAGIRRVLCAPDAVHASATREWLSADGGRSVVPLPRADEPVDSGPDICAPASPDDLAYVAFTSGSTAEPKAVLGRHGALAAYGRWLAAAFGVGPADRFTMLTALSHDPLLRDVFPALQLGGTLCVPSEELFARPGGLAAWASASRVSVANLTPSMAQLMMEGGPTPMGDLRLALFVGEPLTLALVDRFRKLAPAASVVNLYGATETQQSLGWYKVPDDTRGRGRGVVPAGRGMPGVELCIVRDDGRLAGVGEVGEIRVASERLAGGYLGDAALTAARFVAGVPGGIQGRAYRTGDRGWRLPSGEVCVAGRADAQLKVRGFRVEPGEIETHLMRRGAREAAVVSAHVEGGRAVLVAYVSGDIDAGALSSSLRDDLPAHLVPARIVSLDRLPRTGTGKIDRRGLEAYVFAAGTADRYAAPVTPLEIRIAELWADVMGVERVGLHDDFFELGGHSILAARLAARLREALAIDVQIPDVFRHPRVAGLAAVLQARLDANEGVVEALLDELAGLPEDELRALLDGSGSTERPS